MGMLKTLLVWHMGCEVLKPRRSARTHMIEEPLHACELFQIPEPATIQTHEHLARSELPNRARTP